MKVRDSSISSRSRLHKEFSSIDNFENAIDSTFDNDKERSLKTKMSDRKLLRSKKRNGSASVRTSLEYAPFMLDETNERNRGKEAKKFRESLKRNKLLLSGVFKTHLINLDSDNDTPNILTRTNSIFKYI